MKPEVNVCTEQEVEALVRRFYARVREDEVLGPIFEARVHDWQSHLLLLIDFWSTMLRGTSRFSGAPMPKHLAIPGLQCRCSSVGWSCSGRPPRSLATRR
ncbi:group III truncated hemoglobin [Stenotrophomonas pictorum]|uniref:group III truncated hemoglobin n=1 Tax=Stenotrophomonas pictorum TaxID=86184 RepID=UPI0031B61596